MSCPMDHGYFVAMYADTGRRYRAHPTPGQAERLTACTTWRAVRVEPGIEQRRPPGVNVAARSGRPAKAATLTDARADSVEPADLLCPERASRCAPPARLRLRQPVEPSSILAQALGLPRQVGRRNRGAWFPPLAIQACKRSRWAGGYDCRRLLGAVCSPPARRHGR